MFSVPATVVVAEPFQVDAFVKVKVEPGAIVVAAFTVNVAPLEIERLPVMELPDAAIRVAAGPLTLSTVVIAIEPWLVSVPERSGGAPALIVPKLVIAPLS